jgi:hypothetical protein
MSRPHHVPVASLLLVVTVPLAWLACGGGESKPAESPAAESSEPASSGAPADSDTPSASASTASPASDTPAPTASAEAAEASPSAPTFGSTDCGKCVDKTCAKQEAACGKNTDCQSVLDSVHGCSSAGAACFDAVTPPTAAKPKKLATSFETCAKKALNSKACKTKCQ